MVCSCEEHRKKNARVDLMNWTELPIWGNRVKWKGFHFRGFLKAQGSSWKRRRFLWGRDDHSKHEIPVRSKGIALSAVRGTVFFRPSQGFADGRKNATFPVSLVVFKKGINGNVPRRRKKIHFPLLGDFLIIPVGRNRWRFYNRTGRILSANCWTK